MVWWKQLGLVAALVAGVLAAWAVFLPASAPLLARLGLAPDAPAAEAARAPGGPGGGPGGPGAAGPGRFGPPEVVALPVAEAAANGRISAIGNGRALRSVTVTPLVAGRLVEVALAAGDVVEAGTVIARLDDEAEAIGVDRGRLALVDAEGTLERTERLRQTGAATEVQLREARLALDRARLEIRDAELALDRRRIVAPISGVVGILPVEPGQQVGTSTELATIDDRSRILVDFRVPERWAGRVRPGAPLEASALAQPERLLAGTVHAVDNRIDPASRTLLVQAIIENEGDLLRAGMAFRIGMAFEGEAFPAVDPLAIRWSSEGSYVWVVREGRAAQVPVRVAQRSSERVLVAGALLPGDLVVTEGVQRLRDGAEVAVRTDPYADPAAGDAPEDAPEDAPDGAGLGLSRADPAVSDT